MSYLTGFLNQPNGSAGIDANGYMHANDARQLINLNGSAISMGTVGIPYLPVGTSSSLGVLEVGSNINVASGIISIPQSVATSATPTFAQITISNSPLNPTDAATKAYVDATAQGLSVKDSCQLATTANITLSGEQTIDGVTTSSSRVLVKNQTSNIDNGIYISNAGAWTRTADFAAGNNETGAFTFIEQGTINGGTGWYCTSATNVGTTATTFTQFSGAGTYTAGTGLTLTGSQFSLNTATTTAIGGVIVPTAGFISVDGSGNISIPQSVATSATPTFASMTLSANTNQLILGTTNTITFTMASLTGSHLFTLPDAASNPIQPLGSATSHQWVQYTDSAGVQHLSQPSFSDISGTAMISQGGTGATTQQGAINNLTGTQTSGYYLRSNGTNASLSQALAADITIGASFTPSNAAIIANDNLLVAAQKTQGQINNIYSTISPSINSYSVGQALASTDRTVHVTATGQTFTLPDATTMTVNLEYNIKAINVALVTLNTFGSQTIDGAATVSISSYQNMVYYSDGTNLWIR